MEYFAAMFNDRMEETGEFAVPLDPKIVSPDVFDEILNYVYTNEINFTDENAIPICVAADFFNFEDLIQETENYLISNMKAENVSRCLEMAMRIGMNSLEEECKIFIYRKSLSKVAKRDLIPWLSFEDLITVLEEFKRNSKPEEMFHLSIEWVELDVEERKSKLCELLESIPLESLSIEFLQNVIAKQTLVIEDRECSKSLLEAFPNLSSNDSIYVFGGVNEGVHVLSSVSKFDSLTEESSKNLSFISF